MRTVPLDAAALLPAKDAEPDKIAERREIQQKVLEAVRALPEHQRIVTTLFYVNGYSQKEIAHFLEVPVTTVKKRLYDSRQRLKERMIKMVDETLKAHVPGEEFPERVLRLLRAPKPLEIEDHPVSKMWQEVRAEFEG